MLLESMQKSTLRNPFVPRFIEEAFLARPPSYNFGRFIGCGGRCRFRRR